MILKREFPQNESQLRLLKDILNIPTHTPAELKASTNVCAKIAPKTENVSDTGIGESVTKKTAKIGRMKSKLCECLPR